MNIYRSSSLTLMLIFAITGMFFLIFPDKTIVFFNDLSMSSGIPASPLSGWSLYLILATGYMYIVSVLAYLMFRHPENHYFPLLLIHAKLASSILSLALFLFHAQNLIYITNCIVDGIIGIGVLIMYVKMRGKNEFAANHL
jgi:hypothetical protein